MAPDVLTSMLGPAAGRQLFALSHNHDPRPIVVGRRRKSIGSQSAFGRGRRTPAEVDALVIAIVDRVMRRVRAAHRVGRTVVLRLRFDDFTSVTRSHTLAAPTDDTAAVLAAIQALLATAEPLVAERGLTLVGVSVSDLDDAQAVQLALPFPRPGTETPMAAGIADLDAHPGRRAGAVRHQGDRPGRAARPAHRLRGTQAAGLTARQASACVPPSWTTTTPRMISAIPPTVTALRPSSKIILPSTATVATPMPDQTP